jgi:hypothetical protein
MRGHLPRLGPRLPAPPNREYGVTDKVNCLAPGCNGFRAAFQWEMKYSADEAPFDVEAALRRHLASQTCPNGFKLYHYRTNPSLAKSAAVFEPQRGEITKPRPTAWISSSFSPGEKVAEV